MEENWITLPEGIGAVTLVFITSAFGLSLCCRRHGKEAPASDINQLQKESGSNSGSSMSSTSVNYSPLDGGDSPDDDGAIVYR